MPRSFASALVVLVLASPAFAANPPAGTLADAPERLLPPSTQLFVRWDGIAAHADAYRTSVWGGVMAGPTGDTIRALIAKGPKLLGSSVLADPLLEGRPLAELKANLADLKSVEKLIGLIGDKGVVVAAEVREPAPTLRGVGQAFGGLIGGKLPGAEAILPDAQVLIIVPDVGDKAEVIFGSLRLLFKKIEEKIEPFEADGRKGFLLNGPADGPFLQHMAWWVDGKHVVLYAGSRKPAAVVAEMRASATKGGVTGHPLYQRCIRTGGFESVTRGFVDTGRMIDLAKNLAGPFVPGLKERLDGTGLAGLKAVVFASGFDGKESRALYEFDVPGERKGLAKVLKSAPLGVGDLPPMPPDVSRFSALRIDPAATYDAGLGLIDLLAAGAEFGIEEEDEKKPAAAVIKARKEYLARETDKLLGVSMAADVLPHLGDKFVMFQSPTEGLHALGTVVCVSVKDAAKVRAAADHIQRALDAITNSPVKVRKKVLKGVEYREFHSTGFALFTPTYAVVGDWLVLAAHPQLVQGVILRSKGDLERWVPDAATAKRLAKMPEGCGLQFCDPKSTTSNLCCIGPLAVSAFGLKDAFTEQSETDADPIDVGLVPNAHELNRHLFPNLTVTRDDGKTIRVEVNESFSLPLEMVGAEPFIVIAGFSALRF